MSARLLKVIVQPVFITDDGQDLTEVQVHPVMLTAAEWRVLDPNAWAVASVAQVEAQLSPPDET